MCTIVHIWKGENEPQAGGRRHPLRAICSSLEHSTLVAGNWYLAAQPAPARALTCKLPTGTWSLVPRARLRFCLLAFAF